VKKATISVALFSYRQVEYWKYWDVNKASSVKAKPSSATKGSRKIK